ncbi:BQ2448_7387 [Microbotryum intermedium]|uniref:BQ2448_7387 protein n=1 Tax=Microbotryum intermedium TaxID=269621 RepID=A0A238FMS7_9BASI|nr:BQ2448_7387 [Microbotryum intermedium]
MFPRGSRAFSTTLSTLSAASKARKAIPLYLRPRASPSAPKAHPVPVPVPVHPSPSEVPSTPSLHQDGSSTLLMSPKEKGKKREEGFDTLKLNKWAEPPLVAQARAKTVKQRNVWESYLVLPPKTRLYISLGVFVFALIGLYGGDYLVPETEVERNTRIRKEELVQARRAAVAEGKSGSASQVAAT